MPAKWASCEKSEKNRAFYLSLVKPSMLQQARAEVMLHMAHSLFSTFNISFEILEKSKVIFNKLKFDGSQWSLKLQCCLCGCPALLSKPIHSLSSPTLWAEFIQVFFFFFFSRKIWWETWLHSLVFQKKPISL